MFEKFVKAVGKMYNDHRDVCDGVLTGLLFVVNTVIWTNVGFKYGQIKGEADAIKEMARR